MIRYALVCDAAHEFDSWFSTSASFEDLAKRSLLTCPVCGSAKVERAIMAPNIARNDRVAHAEKASDAERAAGAVEPEQSAPASEPATPAPVALMSEKDMAMRAMVAALHRHVTENAEHVGPRFAQEALKIHHGETPARPIFGQATVADARMLREEGVDFLPLPELPDSQN